jgi:hypothetical protein
MTSRLQAQPMCFGPDCAALAVLSVPTARLAFSFIFIEHICIDCCLALHAEKLP